MIKPIFIKVNNTKKQIRLNRFLAGMKNSSALAWYCSAGSDFRDLVELNINAHENNIQLAEYFIHTDAFPKWVEADITIGQHSPEHCMPYNIVDRIDFTIGNTPLWHFETKQEYVDFPDENYKQAQGCLLTVEIAYDNKIYLFNVVYLFLENFNFMELVLRHKLQVLHFVKVREGCAWGNCSKSILPTLHLHAKQLGLKYIITDDSDHSTELPSKISWNKSTFGYRQYFELRRVKYLGAWSMFNSSIYKLEYGLNKMKPEDYASRLTQISKMQ